MWAGQARRLALLAEGMEEARARKAVAGRLLLKKKSSMRPVLTLWGSAASQSTVS